MVVFRDEEQNKKLSEIHTKQEESAVRDLSVDYGINYVDLSGIGINTDALLLIQESVSRDAGIAVFGMVGKKLNVAVMSPTMPKTVEQIDILETKGYAIQLYLVSRKSLEKAWARYADVSGSLRSRSGLLDISDEELQRLATIIHSNDDIRELALSVMHSNEAKKVSKLMEIIFGTAIGTKSSDVHIEAGEEFARLRFRQDGVLQDIVEFPIDMYKSINSRIKLLSELKLSNTAIAQDGRFTIAYKGTDIEIRTSLIPGPYGESIVMRILNPEGLTVEMESMGIQKNLFEILQKEIKKPNGMILTTGPTGSGKTTTLYSFLKRVYTPEIKILTIEDPIEYHLAGITQTQVDHDKGYDFSSGLRAALRQDPNVIMVGEIRDKETASTAVNASLTGHLVLSTLHTNNAAGAIPRLIELGVNSKILPDALTVAMAQRLVRRLCSSCKQERPITPSEEQTIRAVIKNAERSGKDFSSLGITSMGKITMYTPVGCNVCDHIGYKGRIGLYEAILVDETVADIIAENPTERDIKHGAAHQGIFTMVEDGVAKILSGVTSIEEVNSTVDMTEDLPEGWYADITNDMQSQMITSMNTVTQGGMQYVPYQAGSPSVPMSGIQGIPIPERNRKNEIVLPFSGSQPLPNLATLMQRKNNPNDEWQTLTNDFAVASAVSPYASETVLPVQELEILIDYLKMLEQEQVQNPRIGIKLKIAEIKEMIIEIMRNHRGQNWESPHQIIIREEVKGITNSLERLEEHQSRKPNIGVATQLRDIRNTIEKLLRKE